MPVYKDKERGTYYVSCYTSSHKKKTKRGFKTKKAAMEWEREFVLSDHNDLSMTFPKIIFIMKWTGAARRQASSVSAYTI